MVIFNECRIDSLNQRLIIDVSIDNADYANDIGIGHIYLVKSKDFVNESILPESSYILFDSEDTPTHIDITESIEVGKDTEKHRYKNIRVVKSIKELDILGISLTDLLFIYVETIGIPGENTPCNCDNKYTMSIAYDLRNIYNKAMHFIKELNSECDTPKGFIDIFFKLKAFELSLETGNFNNAIKLWPSINNKTISMPSRKCGCN